MLISRKSQYALRAILELSKRYDENAPSKTHDIAEKQKIPVRFLEVILCRLKQAGYVESVRGKEGGYMLAQPPGSITVGDIVRHCEGGLDPVESLNEALKDFSSGRNLSVFTPLWKDVRDSISGVCDSVSFSDLVKKESELLSGDALNFSI